MLGTSGAANQWELSDSVIQLNAPQVVGIVNVTPDSFSDGGRFFDTQLAVVHGLRLIEQGAAILDIGGESTRPGSQSVAAAEQIRRTRGVIAALRQRSPVPISIDTTCAEVALVAIKAGANAVNDTSALREDSEMAAVVADSGAGLVLMHRQGPPPQMQIDPHYENVVGEVTEVLGNQMQAAQAAGIAASKIVLDPGIGFGKTTEHNLQLLAHLDQLHRLGCPLMLGTSRKRFIGELTGQPVDQRLIGTVASCVWALTQQVQLLRVHDVAEVVEALKVAAAIFNARGG